MDNEEIKQAEQEVNAEESAEGEAKVGNEGAE